MINYYRDTWRGRSELLAPLSELTSNKVKSKWNDKHHKSLDALKRIIGREYLLAYPNLNIPIEIHTDASATQLGAVISQHGDPIAFYSRKLNPDQRKYTTPKREGTP